MSLNLDKSNWKRVVLGDVARHITDRVDAETSGLERFLAGEHLPSQCLHIRQWGVVGRDPIGPMFYKRFKPGHVLYLSRRTYLRKTAVPDFSGICGEKTFVLESRDESSLLQRFLPLVLSAEVFHRYAISMSRGSVNPYINWTELAAYEFDLPPLDEQNRIATLLWSLEKHSLTLATLVEATLQTAVPLMTASADGEITVADVVSKARSGATPSRANKSFYGGDIPWLKSGEVVGDAITSADETITDDGLAASAAWVVPPGAILIAMYGDGKTRGQVGRNAVPLATNQAVIALVPDNQKCDPDYFYYWMRSRQEELRAKGAGAAQKNLSKALVVSEPFPKIAIAEQKLVVDRMSAVDDLVAALQEEIADVRRCSTTIRNQIFGACI